MSDPRLPYFEELQQQAASRNIAGLKWTTGKTYTGQPGCIVNRDSGDITAQIEVVWAAHGNERGRGQVAQSQMSAYHSFPMPGRDMFYRISFVRMERKNICFPSPGYVTEDAADVLDVLAAWAVTEPVKASQESQPVLPVVLPALKAIATARKIAVEDPSIVSIDAATISHAGLTPTEADEMRRRIAVEYPREDDGRLPLGAVLLLAPLGEPPSNELLRSDWLVAAAPLKRRDAQVIAVEIQSIIPANHPYRWDSIQSMWNPKLPAPTEAERWGVDAAAFDGVGDPGAEIERLRKVCAKGGGADVERARLSTLLQDAGLLGEAFGLYGIEASEDVWRIASGEMLHAGMEKLQEPWSSATCRALWQCAPWKVAKLIAERAATSKKAPRLRLFALPMQPQQSKTSLMLSALGKSKTPTFDVEGNGSNLRLAEVLWQRPVDLDIRRLGLG